MYHQKELPIDFTHKGTKKSGMCLKHVSAPQTVNFQGRNSHDTGAGYEQEANNGPQHIKEELGVLGQVGR